MTGPDEPPRSASMTIRFMVNGGDCDVSVEPMRRLVDVLREDLDLTGTKVSCAVGVCGACSVLVDGDLVSACLTPAALVDGRAVTTIEGIGGQGGTLSPLQDAFITQGGLQCGACTPGQIVAAAALLADHADPGEDLIREWMGGNLCRCTGYAGIVRAIRLAAAQSPTP